MSSRHAAKRSLVILLAVATAIVVALPAGAKRPDRRTLVAAVNAEPIWVHEAADLLTYTVTLENRASTELEVTVDLTAAGTTDTRTGVTVPANDEVLVDGFSRHVGQFAESAACIATDTDCDLTASVEVLRGGDHLATEIVSTTLDPDPQCEFDAGVAEVNGVCVWTPGKTGVWKISLEPVPPRNPNRPVYASVAVRDHVPGNWCTLAIGTSATFGGRWRDGDGPIEGKMYLPGDEDVAGLGLADGVCLGGGAGGDYFAIGNSDSFYLDARGRVTVSWEREIPCNDDPLDPSYPSCDDS